MKPLIIPPSNEDEYSFWRKRVENYEKSIIAYGARIDSKIYKKDCIEYANQMLEAYRKVKK